MYGTVARARVKPGQLEQLLAVFEQDRKERGKPKGAVGTYLYRLDRDPDEVMIVAVFEDKASYLANADDPEQDKWYRRVREHLAADPEWNDGEAFEI